MVEVGNDSYLGQMSSSDWQLYYSVSSVEEDQATLTFLCSYSGFANVTSLINPQTGEDYASADYLIEQLLDSNLILDQITKRKNMTDESATIQ